MFLIYSLKDALKPVYYPPYCLTSRIFNNWLKFTAIFSCTRLPLLQQIWGRLPVLLKQTAPVPWAMGASTEGSRMGKTGGKLSGPAWVHVCVCVCTPWHWVVRVDRGRLDPSVYATSSHKDECKERTVGTLWGRFNPNITVKRTSSCFISGQLTHDHNLNSEMLTCAFIHTHTLASDHAPPPAVVAVPQHVLLPV
jgi:hypothetical protein